jgi:CO dehydrogenase maturation factor
VAADKIRKLGRDIGIQNIVVVGNRVKSEADRQLIRDSMPGYEILGFIPEMEEIVLADRNGTRPFDDITQMPDELKEITGKLVSLAK